VEENMRGGKGGKARATHKVVVVKEFVDRPFQNDNDHYLWSLKVWKIKNIQFLFGHL
jgi:hypothetical protein